ncbi:hypothetical protein BRARA_H01663 [Brassica rapa]|uniref:DUF7890 domain-containing protein n=2 Tax=Brassica TaxID=3705 RepID=A0A397YCB3_BRACM|nr:uncharacterized protein LOC125577083 [Brassica napus]RID50967.1 hypothetical protein BRARA_H01663 [Brassica rapa]CAF2247601.1 unnamed protein product [Brassica napus]CAG7898779.1 unnamed protein product [Brassica rapa]CDY24799.1 BnaA08g15110D [Brassica napus]VDD05636.1 unnamed protein product [Brassica rapa]
MMDSLAKCFNGLQESYEKVLEAKPIYRDDLDITLPLDGSVVSVESTKKSRCLERTKRIDKSLRFEEEDEDMAKPLVNEEGQKPRKVVRFQLENNKIFEPKKPVRFDPDDHKLEPKEKPLEAKEGLNKAEGKEEVVRVKIKVTKKEADRLLANWKNDSVLDLKDVVDQIAHVSVHQLQVDVVMVACNNGRQGNGCLLSQTE